MLYKDVRWDSEAWESERFGATMAKPSRFLHWKVKAMPIVARVTYCRRLPKM